jgi:hypothetical protein
VLRIVQSDTSLKTNQANAKLFNNTVSAMEPGDRLVFPTDKVFHMMGGIYVENVSDIVIQLDGTIRFWNERKEW